MMLYLVGIALTLLLQAFFAGSETGMISVSLLKLRHKVEQGQRSAKVAYDLLARPDYLLSTTLVGTNIALVTCSSLATSLFVLRLGPDLGAVAATTVVTVLVLIYGEIIPKTVFRQRADRLVPYAARPLRWSQLVLWPLVVVTTNITRGVLHLLGSSHKHKSPFVTKEELRLLVEESGAEGVLAAPEWRLIHGVLDFTHTPVSDVMLPHPRMVSVDYGWDRQRIEQLSRSHGLTRFPVFRGAKPVGFLNVFDLFYHETDWRRLIRPIRTVRPHDRIDVLIADMQAKKENIALVVQGNTVLGMITIQDLMAAILSRLHADEIRPNQTQDDADASSPTA